MRICLVAFIFSVIGLSGCAFNIAQPPSPLSFKLSVKNNLSQFEVDLIFKEVFSETYKVKPFVKQNYNGNPYYDKAAKVRGTTITYSAMNADFGHYFFLQNGVLVREDISEEQNGDLKGEKAYCMLCDDKGFTSYIEDFQVRLSKNLVKRFSLTKQIADF